jgi:hypothetical protein
MFHSGIFSQTSTIHVGFEVLTAVVIKSTIFWDITLCIPLKVNRRFGATYRLHVQGQRISRAARHQRESRWQAEPCLAFTSTLNMEVICSSETSVDFQQTTRRYIPEVRTLQVSSCFLYSLNDMTFS